MRAGQARCTWGAEGVGGRGGRGCIGGQGAPSRGQG